jgi:DNA-binding transcriptional MerR regulator
VTKDDRREDMALGMGSRAVCDLLSLPSSTLNYWIQLGLVHPSIRAPQGRRVQQYWSVEDVVMVRAVRELRKAGASLQQVRKAVVRLADWEYSISSARLFWDGNDVKIQGPDGEVMSGLKRPGQLVWLLAALPLGRWHSQVRRDAQVIDRAEFAQRDRERLEKQRARREPLARVLRKAGATS